MSPVRSRRPRATRSIRCAAPKASTWCCWWPATARCMRHGTGANATAAALPDGIRNGKPRGAWLDRPDLNVTVLITDREPFVAVGHGVQHLTLCTTGSAEGRNARGLERGNRGW